MKIVVVVGIVIVVVLMGMVVVVVVEMASGMGVEGTRVTEVADLARALEAGLASDGPYLVEVVI